MKTVLALIPAAGLGRFPADEEAEMMADYGIKDVACDDLRRGVLVGTVDLYRCDGDRWHLQDPRRATRFVKPTRQPQPVWFKPI